MTLTMQVKSATLNAGNVQVQIGLPGAVPKDDPNLGAGQNQISLSLKPAQAAAFTVGKSVQVTITE